jgi:hypothetical protein
MGKVLLAASAYLVAVALLSRGPLGLARIIGPRLHRALDLVLVVGLVVSPVIARNDLDVAGAIVAEALAIVLLRLALRTRYVPAAAAPVSTVRAAARAGAVAREPGRSAVSEEGGRARAPAEPVEPAAKPPVKSRPAPTTAWTLGVLTARARRRTTGGSDRALGKGARSLGTALGRANRKRTD